MGYSKGMGWLSNKLGRSKFETYANLDHAIKQINDIARRRAGDTTEPVRVI